MGTSSPSLRDALSSGGGTFSGDLQSTTNGVLSDSSGDVNIEASAGNDIVLKLGDAIGADVLGITDSGDVLVASINSDGDLSAAAATFAGDVTLTTGGAIATTANGDLTLNPDGTGEVVISDTLVKVGEGADVDIDLIANNGDVNLPRLRYDSGDSEWQFSNDGTTFTTLGAPFSGDLLSTTNGVLSHSTLDLSIEASAGNNIILKLGDAIGADKLSVTDSANAEQFAVTSDGETRQASYWEQEEESAPAVSASGEVRVYFDSTAKKWKGSEDGGAYQNIIGGTTELFQDINLHIVQEAGAFRTPAAEVKSRAGTTNTSTIMSTAAFDDTTEEFLAWTFRLPGDMDTGGDVSIKIPWIPTTASSSNVVWKIYHASRADAESFDVAMSTTSVTDAGSASTDVISVAEISTTLATLGWAPGDTLIFHVSRDAANGSDTLTGDAELLDVTIRIPLAVSVSANGVDAGGVTAAAEAVMTNGSTAASQMDYDADYVVMADGNSGTSQGFRAFSGINETFDITTDLDTGSEASGTWYYFWLVSTDGSTITRKVSTSATLPTGLNADDFRLRVGSVYNDGSSDFRNVKKFGNKTEYTGNVFNVASGGTNTPWTSVSLTAYMPPESCRVYGILSNNCNVVGSQGQVTGDSSRTAGALLTASHKGLVQLDPATPFSGSGISGVEFDIMTITAAQTIYWGSSGDAKLYVSGYYEEVSG